jgi:hypothetical protein
MERIPVFFIGSGILFVFLFSPVSNCIAQNTSQTEDSVVKKKHSPRLAMLMSAVVPGLGQAYNKKYWKIPVVYAGLGALGYFAYRNGNYYNSFKNAYATLYNSGNRDSTIFLYGVDYNLNGLDAGKNYYRRYRDMYSIFTVGFYLLNIIDANVDANLYDFDISDDISLRISPASEQVPMAGPVPVVKFRITF